MIFALGVAGLLGYNALWSCGSAKSTKRSSSLACLTRETTLLRVASLPLGPLTPRIVGSTGLLGLSWWETTSLAGETWEASLLGLGWREATSLLGLTRLAWEAWEASLFGLSRRETASLLGLPRLSRETWESREAGRGATRLGRRRNSGETRRNTWILRLARETGETWESGLFGLKRLRWHCLWYLWLGRSLRRWWRPSRGSWRDTLGWRVRVRAWR